MSGLPRNIENTERPLINCNDNYRGRFAPSPSGFLHFGSLIAALASYLDAKSTINANGKQGIWLVRIEDIDPPRELLGASKAILSTLDDFGLHWDEDVLYQSRQTEYYRDTLNDLHQQGLSYYCECTRKTIKDSGGLYQSTCRHLNIPPTDSATRLVNKFGFNQFTDLFQGEVYCNKLLAEEDFIIHRKDQLFAYQLAVVHDDIYQNINHVIRGCDLLEPTARQLTLFKTLNKPPPQYGHVPLAVTNKGYKLSKQNKAPAIDVHKPQPALISALQFLGQEPENELIHESVENIIKWAIEHWDRKKIAKVHEINIETNP